MAGKRIYKHLTKTDRLRIEKWLGLGLEKSVIADKLRVSLRTIYRELERGRYERLDSDTWEMLTAYSADIAEDKYQANLREKGPDLKIGNDLALADHLEMLMTECNYSPAAAIAKTKEEGMEVNISVPTLYSYIQKGVFRSLTAKQLPRHGKGSKTYKKTQKKDPLRAPAGESIEKRPEDVNNRETFGHWEGDTVYSGKRKKTKSALFTMTERKTRKEIIIKVPDRQAETIVKAIDALERKWTAPIFRKVFKSITFDNGSEFALTDELEASCINKTIRRTKIYYAHAYSSFERGTNENQNGMIRRRHPKGTDFDDVSQKELKETEDWMNDYPRKILGYKSSNKIFKEELLKLGIAVM